MNRDAFVLPVAQATPARLVSRVEQVDDCLRFSIQRVLAETATQKTAIEKL